MWTKSQERPGELVGAYLEAPDHVWQLLMNDLFLENYFIIFGKHKDRVIIEIPVDDKPEVLFIQ